MVPRYTPHDHRIITYKTGFEAGKTGGLNATTDIALIVTTFAHLRIIKHPVLGYVPGYDITCHIGILK